MTNDLQLNPYEEINEENVDALNNGAELSLIPERFTITNDVKAEWALNKIKDTNNELDRLSGVCQTQIDIYSEKKEYYQQQKSRKTSFLRGLLGAYFDKVPHKNTKTSEKYSLPSGTLTRKRTAPTYNRDDEEILGFLGAENVTEFIETTPKLAWSEFKKQVEIRDVFIDENGKILENVHVNIDGFICYDCTPNVPLLDATVVKNAAIFEGKIVDGLKIIPNPDVFEVKTI